MIVFAPGKLVLTGAYAVLHGAPAVVVATRRGAFADSSRTTPTPTPEVRAALGPSAQAPHVDASSLFFGARKLGLGASSAILVASLGAQKACQGALLTSPDVRASLFESARRAHATAQSGGSGVDVATSVYGGVLEYVPGVATPRELPKGLHLTVFACGTSARTSELRAQVDRLAASSPVRHRACLHDLETIAHAAAKAIKIGHAEDFVAAVQQSARALARLGEVSGADIVPEGFKALEDLAIAEQAAFCVSGAGGGDVAVFLASARPSGSFLEHARLRGLIELDVALDKEGVRLVTNVLGPPARGSGDS